MAATPPLCDFGWPAFDARLPGVDGFTHSIF
ncbi:thioredoxin family protein, partial [Sinorhizobium meliloti]